MKFTVTEKELCEATGYSRQNLRFLRRGQTQMQNGKEYVSAPVLVEGKDWAIFYGRVLYEPGIVDWLRKQKESSGSWHN